MRSTYPNVRFNRVLAHETQASILGRLPPPRPHDYAVQLLVSLGVLVGSTAAVFGLPFPPVVFELAMVDYRAAFFSDRGERYANMVALWDSMHLKQRAKRMRTQNGYLRMMLRRYDEMKAYCEQHGVPVVPRRFAPDSVYDAILAYQALER